jgi:hypothetical protein
MATTPNEPDALGRVRDALFDAGRKATRLAESVERLEARYARAENPNPEYFYVPTDLDGTWGRTLDPLWKDHAPERERRPRREAIDATLALRAAVDSAMEAVAGIAAEIDGGSQSVDQRWTTRTIGHLRELRGAIVQGHGYDAIPSALPMIRAGVPAAMREHARHVSQRMEEVKSAIVAGIKTRTPTVSVSPDLLARLERAAALSLSSHGSTTVEKPLTFDKWVRVEVSSIRRLHPKIEDEMLAATLRTLEMARAEREKSVQIGILDCSPWRWGRRPEGERRAIRLAVLRSLHDGGEDWGAHEKIVPIPSPIEGKFARPFHEMTLAEWHYLAGEPIDEGQDLDSKRSWMFKGLTSATVEDWVARLKEKTARMFGAGDTTALSIVEQKLDTPANRAPGVTHNTQVITQRDGADRAAAKVARAIGGGDNDDSGASSNSTFRKPSGWTRKELIDEAKEYTSFSATGFDRIRKAAQIKPGARGGKGQQRRFGKGELRKLIDAVVSSRVRTRKKIAEAWRGLLAV